IVDDDDPALGGEGLRDRCADAAARAGDEDGPVAELHGALSFGGRRSLFTTGCMSIWRAIRPRLRKVSAPLCKASRSKRPRPSRSVVAETLERLRSLMMSRLTASSRPLMARVTAMRAASSGFAIIHAAESR